MGNKRDTGGRFIRTVWSDDLTGALKDAFAQGPAQAAQSEYLH
jgi:hypothetical protein